MAAEEERTTSKLIRDLFLVLGLGICCAVAVAAVTLHYMGPTGSYLAQNILLNPSMLGKLQYSDVNAQTGGTVPYRFDRLEFAYFDDNTHQWKKNRIAKERYAQFYELIGNDQSLLVVPDQIEALFSAGTPATLSIVVHQEEQRRRTQSFQKVEILNHGDYYRIQIHDERELKNWAYFYHENIFKETLKIFSSLEGVRQL